MSSLFSISFMDSDLLFLVKCRIVRAVCKDLTNRFCGYYPLVLDKGNREKETTHY